MKNKKNMILPIQKAKSSRRKAIKVNKVPAKINGLKKIILSVQQTRR